MKHKGQRFCRDLMSETEVAAELGVNAFVNHVGLDGEASSAQQNAEAH